MVLKYETPTVGVLKHSEERVTTLSQWFTLVGVSIRKINFEISLGCLSTSKLQNILK